MKNPSLEQLEEGDSYPAMDPDLRCCSTTCIRNINLQTNIVTMSLIHKASVSVIHMAQGEEKGSFAQPRYPKSSYMRDRHGRKERKDGLRVMENEWLD